MKKLIKLESTGMYKHRCIVVSDPLHLYKTSNEIITHNSPMTSYSQPYDSLVQLVDESFVEMGSLKLGDELKPVLSERSFVTNIIEQGEQDTYELDFGNDIKIRCSLGHWWLLWDFENEEYVKIQTKSFIKNRDRYGVPELDDLKRDRDLVIACHEKFERDHTVIRLGFGFKTI